MNILQLLIPKINTSFVYDDFTCKQCILKMQYYGYTSLPIITKSGMYDGIITEGDLLKEILKNYDKKELNTEKIYISKIEGVKERKSLKCYDSFTDLFKIIENQNFVPIVDDRGAYMGIITRKKVLEYLKEKALN